MSKYATISRKEGKYRIAIYEQNDDIDAEVEDILREEIYVDCLSLFFTEGQ